MKSKILMGAIITIAIVAGLIIGLNDNNYLDTPVNSNNLSIKNQSSGDENKSGEIDINLPSGELKSGDNKNDDIVSPINVPNNVKAVYATGWVTGTPKLRTSMINSLKENGYNAIVIDIKDEAGQLSYDSSVQTAIDIKASRKMISNISNVINEFKENDIYVIGRIVTFKDPIYASSPATNIAYRKNDGTVWKDYNGKCWPNPYNKDSWKYPIELAKEAASLGFQEIQFDYVRFPSSEGKTSTIAYGFERSTKTKADIISEFLQTAMNELKPYNVVVSADVFGITTKKDGDFENIGQDFARISSIVDVVCPMVYPSHYGFNEYKISKPDLKPYDIVYKSLEDAFKRYNTYTSGDSEIKMAKIRPYLQDFTASWLGKGNYMTYGNDAVKSQIQASFDLGLYDFTLWDPSNKYCYSALKDVTIKENISGDTNISGE